MYIYYLMDLAGEIVNIVYIAYRTGLSDAMETESNKEVL